MVLLVLLYEPESEFPDERTPGEERKGVPAGLSLGPALRRVLRHERHRVVHGFLFREFTTVDERLRREPDEGFDGVQEGPALRAVAVEDERGVRSEDRFWVWSNIVKEA